MKDIKILVKISLGDPARTPPEVVKKGKKKEKKNKMGGGRNQNTGQLGGKILIINREKGPKYVHVYTSTVLNQILTYNA